MLLLDCHQYNLKFIMGVNVIFRKKYLFHKLSSLNYLCFFLNYRHKRVKAEQVKDFV